MGDGYFGLLCEGEGYLTSADTGNGLFYTEQTSDCSKWQFEDKVFLRNIGANYNDVHNQYLEYYSSRFTTYGLNTSKLAAFTMNFYRLGNSKPEEEVLEEHNYFLPLIDTSDAHGYLADTSGEEPLYLLAFISDKVKDIRGSDDAAGKDKLILLDGGDIYQENILSNLLFGNPMSAAFQIMGYDAATIGNHEFDWGIEKMIDPDHTMMDYTIGSTSGVNSVPTIVCNLYKDGEKFSRADDCIILDKTAVDEEGNELPVKVGVIGYAGEYSDSIMYNMFKGIGYSIDPDFDRVNKLAQYLETERGCDATILLAHETVRDVAEGVGEDSVIDLVLGGHTHNTIKSQTSWGLYYFEPCCKGNSYAYTEMSLIKQTVLQPSKKWRTPRS